MSFYCFAMTKGDTIDRKEGLAPLVGKNPVFLILGSLPSDISIAKQEYYANPTNLFWIVFAGVFDCPIPNSYEEKIVFLNQHHVALWDSLHSAARKGSLDSAIKQGVPNDIAGFIRRYPTVKVIVLNGCRAKKEFRKVIRASGNVFKGIDILPLPSTSSMIRSRGYTPESLTQEWKQIITAYEKVRLHDNRLSAPVWSSGNGKEPQEIGERGLGASVGMSFVQQPIWSGRVNRIPQKGDCMRTKGNSLYLDLWEKNLPVILKLIDNGSGDCQLSAKEFEKCGNRKSFSFRLEISNGNVPVKAGSAVARDLKTALDSSPSFKSKAVGKQIAIRLDSQFVLHVAIA